MISEEIISDYYKILGTKYFHLDVMNRKNLTSTQVCKFTKPSVSLHSRLIFCVFQFVAASMKMTGTIWLKISNQTERRDGPQCLVENNTLKGYSRIL